MQKKYIFLDIDGTLLDCSGGEYIPDSASAAVAAARRKGHLVFVCTGRTPGEVSDKVKSVGFDGYVCSAGADIIIGDKVIFQHAILPEELLRLQDLAAANGFGIVLQGAVKSFIDERGMGFFEEINGQREMDSEFGKIPLSKFTPLDIYRKMPERISKVLYLTTDLVKLKAAFAQLKPDYHMALHGVAGVTVLMGELSTSGVVKSTGIERVVKYFGEPDVVTYAYGDSNNDVDMIAAVTHGVAMGNALDSVKAVADEICETLRDDGIYKSFKRNGLI